jgi:hypothetical protein
MRRSFLVLMLVGGLLVACAGQATTPPQSGAPASAAPAASPPASTPLAAATLAPSAPPAPTEPPSATPTAEFAPFRLTGTGNEVVKVTNIPPYDSALVTVTNKGSFLVVAALDQGGELLQVLVNKHGNFTGTDLLISDGMAVAFARYATAFEIQSDGAWTIVVKPTTAARKWNPTTKLSGRGDDVVLVRPPSSGVTTLLLTHDGLHNFEVKAYPMSTKYALIVNAVGHYYATNDLPDGTVILTVEADGVWSVTPE